MDRALLVSAAPVEGVLALTLLPLPNGTPPLVLENRSPWPLTVHQRPTSALAPGIATPERVQVPARSSLGYALMDPEGPEVLVVTAGDRAFEVKVAEGGRGGMLELRGAGADRPPCPLHYGVRRGAGGAMHVLFTPWGATLGAVQPPDRRCGQWDVKVHLPRVGVSVVEDDPGMQELAYLCLTDLQVRLRRTSTHRQAWVELAGLQLDDQAVGAVHPVVLAPTHPADPRDPDPFLRVTLEQIRGMAPRHLRLASASFSVVECGLCLSDGLLYRFRRLGVRLLLPLRSADSAVARAAADPREALGRTGPAAVTSGPANPTIHLEKLQLLPVKLNVTISRTGDAPSDPLQDLLGGASVFIGAMSNIQFRWNCLLFETVTGRLRPFLDQLTQRYVQQTWVQVYKIPASMDVLGGLSSPLLSLSPCPSLNVGPRPGAARPPGLFLPRSGVNRAGAVQLPTLGSVLVSIGCGPGRGQSDTCCVRSIERGCSIAPKW